MLTDAAHGGTSEETIVERTLLGEVISGSTSHLVDFMPRHPELGKCIKCNKGPPAGHKLGRCKGCRFATYCGTACQKADWPTHKSVCRSRRDAAEDPGYILHTKMAQGYALKEWAVAHRWALERVARTWVYLDTGGFDAVSERERVFLLIVRLDDRERLANRARALGCVEEASFFRAYMSGLASRQYLEENEREMLREWDHAAAERGVGEGTEWGKRCVGAVPMVLRAGTGTCVVTHCNLFSLRCEGSPDRAARGVLEDFLELCMDVVNRGLRLIPLDPRDAVAYPQTRINRNNRAILPWTRYWAEDPREPLSPGKATGLGPEELMRAYSALEC